MDIGDTSWSLARYLDSNVCSKFSLALWNLRTADLFQLYPEFTA